MAALVAWCVSAGNASMTGQVLFPDMFPDSGLECAARAGQTR